MASSPPRPRHEARPAARVALDAVRFEARGAGDEVIFFSVENAPRAACETGVSPGSLSFRTRVCGRVRAVERGRLILEGGGRRVTVRHHLPEGIDLAPLVGHRLRLALEQRYRGRGRATIDAELRDEAGRLLLWAHDGRMPEDGEGRGLTFRRALSPGGARLAVRARSLVSVRCPGVARLRLGEGEFALALARLEEDDVGFVMLRR